MLRLQLLGGFHAHGENGELTALAKQQRRAALLAYLAIERKVARSRVITLLWPDADTERGRHSLNQAIYFLRRIIGADWVELRGDECVVAPWVSTDVDELEHAAAAGMHERVLQLYAGSLLAGTTLASTIDFEMWLDRRRAAIDRLHRRARRQQLATLREAGRTQDALHCAEEWCRLDPLEDEAQHRYMELLASVGQRGAALRQFSAYQRLLEEYELKPLDETIALVEQLQHGELSSLPAPVAQHTPSASATSGVPSARPGAPEGAGLRLAEPASQRLSPHGAPDTTREVMQQRTEPAAAPAAPRERGPLENLVHSRRGLCALLAGIFVFNWLETTFESWLAARLPVIESLRLHVARASHSLEGYLSFQHHELTNRFAVIGYSAAYFIVFPLLLVAIGVTLARRSSIRPFRAFTLAIAVNYAINLPFFLLFPVPERWYYPDSGAVVLSDLWSTRLIEVFRPISGLDNSFPSFHVSLTVLLVLTCFTFLVRYRWSVLFLGATIVLATLALGIHWITDLVAGMAVGIVSLAIALTLDGRLADPSSPQPATQPPAVRRPLSELKQLEPT